MKKIINIYLNKYMHGLHHKILYNYCINKIDLLNKRTRLYKSVLNVCFILAKKHTPKHLKMHDCQFNVYFQQEILDYNNIVLGYRFDDEVRLHSVTVEQY